MPYFSHRLSGRHTIRSCRSYPTPSLLCLFKVQLWLHWQANMAEGARVKGAKDKRGLEATVSCLYHLCTHKELFLRVTDVSYRWGVSLQIMSFLWNQNYKESWEKLESPEVVLGMNLNILLGLVQNWLPPPPGLCNWKLSWLHVMGLVPYKFGHWLW